MSESPGGEGAGIGGHPLTRAYFLAAGSYSALAGFFFLGFVTHRSSVGVIGPYTPGYLAFLAVIAFLLLIPLGAMTVAFRLFGTKRTVRLAGGAGLILLVIYGAAEVVYASTREHSFDPFLQFPGTRFELVDKVPAEGVTRVITLGGSTTHNAHLPEDHRYPRILERLLNEGAGTYEVMNAGMDWWTTKHSHINYATYLRAWSPEVVVVMHGINDLYRSFAPPRFSMGPYDTQWSHFYGPAIRGARPRTLLGATLNRWTVWDMDRRWYGRWRYKDQDYDLSAYRSLPEFEFSLRSLVRTLKADGVRVILLTQPSLYKENMSVREAANLWFPSMFCVTPQGPWVRHRPSPNSMARAMEAYNGVTLRTAAEEGVEVVDVAARVPRSLEYFGDDVHYTELGSTRVAEAVAAKLGGRQALSEAPTSSSSRVGIKPGASPTGGP